MMASCSSSSSSSDGTTASSNPSSTLNAGTLGTVTEIKAVASKMTDGSGNWQVILSWTNPTSATTLTYTIERSEETDTVPTKTFKNNYVNITSPYTVRNLPAQSTQYFVVIVTGTVNNTSASVRSPEYSVKIPLDEHTQKPGAFTMTVAAGNGQVTLSWADSERASFYIIQRGTTSQSYPTVVGRLASKPYVDSGLTNGQTYYYIIIAVNSAGSTSATAEAVAQPLGAPGTFVLTAIPGESKITLNWTSSDNAQNYSIFRSTTETTGFTKLIDITASTLSYEDSTVANNTLYYYKIVASWQPAMGKCVSTSTGGVSCSELEVFGDPIEISSNSVSASPASLPQNFTAAASPGDTTVTVTWTPSEGALSYTLLYGTSMGLYPELVSNSATSGIVVSGLTNGTTYYFSVIATNPSGDTNSSNSLSAIPNPWTRQLGVLGAVTFGRGVTSDSSGNIFVTGSTAGNLDGEIRTGITDSFVTKYSSLGVKQWTRLLGASGGDIYAQAIVSDSSGNVYVAGRTNQPLPGNALTGTYDFFVGKYDTLGNLIWLKQLGASGQITYGHGITIDPSGNVYVTGYTYGALPGNTLTGILDFFVGKYDDLGNLIWIRQSGVSGAYTDGQRITSDSSGNVYVSGSTNGALPGNALTGYLDFFVTKYDTLGNMIWIKQSGASGAGTSGQNITSDSNNNVYIAGYTDGSLPGNISSGGTDFFITKYDNLGNMIWIKQLGVGGGGYTTEGYGITSDSSGNIYVSGTTDGPLLGNTATFSNDFFVTKYDNLGNMIWIKQLGVAGGGTNGHAITSDSNNNVYVTGVTTAGLDGNTLTGSYDFFVVKYNSSGLKQ